MQPTIGRIVHYILSAQDAEQINKRRTDWAESVAETASGFVAHVGNEAREGQVLPMMVVAAWGGDAVNGQVHLDGNDTFWATSRKEGDEPGTWSWPPRV